jgi:cytochrome c-type biogenesis protein CcmH
MLILLISLTATANETLVFESPVKVQAYEQLIKELRCVTCPNQSIADSQAPVAQAMREDIFQRLAAGESSQSIRDYLLVRYGDYVLYRPRVKAATWFLWAGPFLLLGVGLLGFRSRIKSC